jgi:hypothetical protein
LAVDQPDILRAQHAAAVGNKAAVGLPRIDDLLGSFRRQRPDK